MLVSLKALLQQPHKAHSERSERFLYYFTELEFDILAYYFSVLLWVERYI